MLLDFCNSMSVEFGLKGNVAREGDETSSFPGSIAIGREHVLLKTDFFSTPAPLGGVDKSHMRLYCSIVAFSREVYCCRMLVPRVRCRSCQAMGDWAMPSWLWLDLVGRCN